ncbi:hypothetical protein HAX54_033935 [Datura stramonium]|uniref:Uncharacterized protein n=1 Tax=Datura stramonium TaxID=4076 RepID=A0ABS8VES4_DATST|nr:hypothetical protein [Datura stramonium]
MLIEWLQKGCGIGTSASPLVSRKADPVKCGELVAVLGIDGEEGTQPTLQKPVKPVASGIRASLIAYREEEEATFQGDNQGIEPQKKSKSSRRDKSRGRDPSATPVSEGLTHEEAEGLRREPDGRLLLKQNEERGTEASLSPIGFVMAKATATDHLNSAKTMRSGRSESTTVMGVICVVTSLTCTETAKS